MQGRYLNGYFHSLDEDSKNRKSLNNMDIEWLQSFCRSLPAATEDIKWGNDLCFSIGGKMFCVAGLTGDLKASLKVTPEEFDELCGRDGVIPAPYMARHKWILVEAKSFNSKEWKHHVKKSYALVKEKLPAKTKKELFGQ